ncbi:MAG: septum formation protein Maf [Betaproteobacteria bacterium]|nr:MAG: septum formation protein Maf [Betaproteobacteria bacterium]
MIFSSETEVVLASGSRYRRALLDQLGLHYLACPADIEETARAGELPTATASRLASEKARAVARTYPTALVIGSDQVGSLDGLTAFSKPGNHVEAVAQLARMSGRTVRFHTAVCLFNARTAAERNALVTTEVRFRKLAAEVIEAYLERDRPYDCAGSAKIESLGIALVERVTSDDPTALLGLPLIALIDLLAAEGIRVV